MKNSSYFAWLDEWNPLYLLKRYANPFRFKQTIQYAGKPLSVFLTKRAYTALQTRTHPLMVEMQLYFSCVIKKRVLFHDELSAGAVAVNPSLYISSRAVQSDRCDPDEFANHYPTRQELNSPAAQKMRPSELRLDYEKGEWLAEFQI